jgi:hypothetical protein
VTLIDSDGLSGTDTWRRSSPRSAPGQQLLFEIIVEQI